MSGRRLVVGAASAMLSVCLSGCLVGKAHRLEIAEHGRVSWAHAVRAGDTFDVSFVHSQERTRWTQHYRVADGGSLMQTGSTFGSYGAGMPIGSAVRTDDGFTAPLELRLSAIPMLAAASAELTLIVEGRRVALDQWFQDYDAFEIRIR